MVMCMQKRYIKYMKTLNNIIFLLMITSCSSVLNTTNDKASLDSATKKAFCTIADEKKTQFTEYRRGDLPCLKYRLKVSPSEYLDIEYITLDEDADDLYDRGYQVLKRIKLKKLLR
jgi:hypothetical protein